MLHLADLLSNNCLNVTLKMVLSCLAIVDWFVYNYRCFGLINGKLYLHKLQSLDTLLDAKSNDKKLTLLHYIVKTVKEKFPELANFDSELRYIEKASGVSLENIIVDLGELEKGMERTKREHDLRSRDREPPAILKEFLVNSEDKLKKLLADARTAKDSYKVVVEYFGEKPSTLAPNTFFTLFCRFIRLYRQADQELEAMKKQEETPVHKSFRKNSTTAQQQQQQPPEGMVNELQKKQRQIHEKKVLQRDEVYHGALEDILLDLKNEPYRRADAVRRSQRRRVEVSAKNDVANQRF